MTDPSPIDPNLITDLLKTTKEATDSILRHNNRGGNRKPYYTAKWAGYVGDLLTLVYTTGEPQLIPEGQNTAATIRNQWYQAKEYLLAHMDPENKFKEMDDCIAAEYVKKRGMIVSPKRKSGILKHVAVVPWRPKLEEFIETAAEMQKFERIGLGLTEDDAKYVNELLRPLEDMFVWHVDVLHDSLRVVRVTQEKLEELNKG